MKSVLVKIKERAKEEADKLNLDLIDVEWVNEFGNNILRITADTEDGLTIDESTALNEKMSDALDEMDLIEDDYMLEVSSPGIERELKTDEEVLKNVGKYIHIDFLNHFPITAKTKVLDIEGTLENFDGTTLVVKFNNKGQIKMLEIDKNLIKLIRLAIKF